MTRVRIWLALLLLCGSAASASSEVTANGGTMTWGTHVTLAQQWLDPADTEPIITPFMVLYALHDALIKPTPAGLHTPSLAESWKVSPDGLRYDFTLRKGALFHNGEPVTAEDVAFSFRRYRGTAAALLKQKVREVQVIDPLHVRFVLAEPWPDFLLVYGTPVSGAGWIVPKKYVEQVGDEGFRRAPIGAGPYKFVSFKPGVELVADAFDRYWRKSPSVRRIVLRSLPDETTRAAALLSGEIDVAYLLSGPVAQGVQRSPALKTVSALAYGVLFLDFPDQQNASSPWHDARVRQAASLAVDRDALNQAETLGFSRPTGSIVPPDFEFALGIPAPAYAPERARALLAQAGHPDGFDAGDFYPIPGYESLGEAVAGYLQAIGIRTRIRNMERAAFLAAWREGKLRGLVLGLAGGPGNAASRIEAYATQTGAFSSGAVPELESLFQKQARETDPRKREALLQQIQRLLEERAIHAPLYQLGAISAIGPRVAESGVGKVAGFPFSAMYEDVALVP